MNTTAVPTQAARPASRWLILARAGWVVITVLALTLMLAGLPGRFLSLLAGYERSLGGTAIVPAAAAAYAVILVAAVVLVHVALATILFLRAPRDPVALLVAVTLSANGALLPLAFLYGEVALPPYSRFLVNVVACAGLISSIFTLYLFPDGRFVPRWTLALAAVWAVVSLLAVFIPTGLGSFTHWPLLLQAALLLIWVVTGLYAQFYRYTEVSDLTQRQQAKWAAAGLLAAAMTPLVYFLSFAVLPAMDLELLPSQLINRIGPAILTLPALGGLVGMTLLALGMMIFPTSFVIAVLRYRLWDIDFVINRTLVYGSLTAVVVVIYGLIVGGLTLVLQTQASAALAVVAAVVVALLALPLRQRLQRAVNRLMYGERDDPWAVLSKLAMTLEAASAPADLLPNLARNVAESLRLPYVAISVGDGEGSRVVAEHSPSPPAPLPEGEGSAGKLPSPPGRGVGGEGTARPALTWPNGETLPLIYQGAVVGQLFVAQRAPGEAFSSADRRLLADLARQAGPAVHAVQLTADLQRSRQRLVTTREEERRRLRRDLHDGLGPQLASLSLKADTARNLVASDPAAVDRLLTEVKSQTQDAISDIRRLVHGLRPPALDQLGLAGALREQANALSGDGGVQIVVAAPDDLPTLPAAVEVAAYRIVTEALTNVVRHAGAHRCTVWLCLDADALNLAVDDDGAGLPADYRSGVGLASMRERAEELGGACQIEPRAEGGTRVAARLPVS